MECIGILIAFTAKWYKSGKYNRHRFVGFIMTLIVTIYWAIYLGYKGLWWLVFYNIINLLLAIRGIINNK